MTTRELNAAIEAAKKLKKPVPSVDAYKQLHNERTRESMRRMRERQRNGRK